MDRGTGFRINHARKTAGVGDRRLSAAMLRIHSSPCAKFIRLGRPGPNDPPNAGGDPVPPEAGPRSMVGRNAKHSSVRLERRLRSADEPRAEILVPAGV